MTAERLTAELEAAAADVAEAAADLIRSSIGRAAVAGTKSSPTDVVTKTDVAAEKLIRQELERRWPGSSFLGEELDDTTGWSGVGWILDPLDGTVNFLYDLPVVSVSIAATVDGRVVAGAVADIVRGELFSAAEGRGAHRDGAAIEVRPTSELAEALILTGFSYDADRRRRQATVVGRVLPEARDIRCFGSAALHLCWVACGRADGYFETDTKLYDFAAGALIAAEAGATVDLPDGPDSPLVATVPAIHPLLRDLIA